MQSVEEQNTPVQARAVLIDPGSMTVVWMNESASQEFSGSDVVGVPIEQAVPIAVTLGVPEALRAAAETGAAQHLRANLVSTTRGSVAIATSIYRLPDGKLLMLTEHAWHAERATAAERASRRPGRRGR